MAAAYLHMIGARRRRVPRIIRDRRNPLDFMCDQELIGKYRLDRAAITDLCATLYDDLQHPTGRSSFLCVSLQVVIALRYYGTGSFQAVTGDVHGVGKMSVSRCVHRVSAALARRVGDYIKFPTTDAEMRNVKENFFQVAGFPNVLGAIDGTLVPIKGPSADEHLYICRKGYHALNIQGISDADYKFVNIVARWPGSSHDAFVWGNCQLADELDHGQVKGWLLGDSAYPLRPWILTTFTNPVTRPQRRYNSAHCKTRVRVEQMFGIWKSRFRCVHKSGGCMMFRPERCVVIIVATAILHNICIDRRLPAPEVDDAASDSDGDEGDGDGDGDDHQQNNRNDGVIARDNIMRAVFP